MISTSMSGLSVLLTKPLGWQSSLNTQFDKSVLQEGRDRGLLAPGTGRESPSSITFKESAESFCPGQCQSMPRGRPSDSLLQTQDIT